VAYLYKCIDIGVQVRDADERDLPGITELFRAVENTTWEYTEVPHTLEERTAWFSEQKCAGWPVLVADDGSKVIGVATYGEFRDSSRWPGYRITVEHTIHVDQAHHRRGVGRAVMTELIRRANTNGVQVMVAGIDSTNLISIAFHERLGFRETARMPGVAEKWGRSLELVLMQRQTSPPVS
jgi:L-amino acid N-acyltransferase